MPVLERSSYRPPFYLFNSHLQTVVPNRLRRVRGVRYRRERVSTPDGDFLDLDWSRVGGDRVAVLSHGLVGCSRSPYILGMVRALNRRGWDALAWNFRGCSGELNRKPYAYHSGKTEDVHVVIERVRAEYRAVVLVGFSLGGNMVLKYLGEREDLAPEVRAGVVFSVPCDLRSGALKMQEPQNRFYLDYLMRGLRDLIARKARAMPERISAEGLAEVRDFVMFDNRYTAPLNGFRDAEAYYQECSSRAFLRGIRVPTLIVNARNDPFLGAACYPVAEAADQPYVFLEMPEAGGHAGFPLGKSVCWSEIRAVEFLEGAHEAVFCGSP